MCFNAFLFVHNRICLFILNYFTFFAYKPKRDVLYRIYYLSKKQNILMMLVLFGNWIHNIFLVALKIFKIQKFAFNYHSNLLYRCKHLLDCSVASCQHLIVILFQVIFVREQNEGECMQDRSLQSLLLTIFSTQSFQVLE